MFFFFRFKEGLVLAVSPEAGADFEHADFLAPGSPPGRPGPVFGVATQTEIENLPGLLDQALAPLLVG